ncbi:MAG: DUF6456 domain-containing protein [Alphaproteobacteria bacterium]|nr:DUF6456 domain-containing protein [Alphaproteobacteria bacterium]
MVSRRVSSSAFLSLLVVPDLLDRQQRSLHEAEGGELSPRSDSGPSQLWQHTGRMLVRTDGEQTLVSRVTEEKVLDVLFYRGVVSPRMRAAGLRLHADFIAADMQPHASGSYNPAHVSGASYGLWHERSDAQEEAYTRWRTAVRAVGQLCSDVVISVACYDLRPDDNHVPLLQVGLAKLAQEYEGERLKRRYQ